MLHIVAQHKMVVDGEIHVDGAGASAGSMNGGGAGGSLLIQTGHFSGNTEVLVFCITS